MGHLSLNTLIATIEFGRQYSGCTCESYMMNVHNSHVMVNRFAVQVTSGDKPQFQRGAMCCTVSQYHAREILVSLDLPLH